MHYIHCMKHWLFSLEIVNVILVILVCLRIIYDTRSTTKTLAYLLVVIFIPVFGVIFYFSFGINYRKRKIYSKKLIQDDVLRKKFQHDIIEYSRHTLDEKNPMIEPYKELATMLMKDSMSSVTGNNSVKLLVNGEQKFPAVIEALEKAKNHIHIEYYIYEDEAIGRKIEEVLVRKAKEGIKIRFIYDDFGSRSIRKKMKARLQAAGIDVFPFYKIKIIFLANRLNYRDHRKIIVIDGCVGFVGGINVSDRYINQPGNGNELFWRDTHLQIDGPGVLYLQYLFLCDWNYCAGENLRPDTNFFPAPSQDAVADHKIVQIAASGPDSDTPTILYAMLQAINLAEREILITTPYFIPGESIQDALIVSALGGVSVKLLVPDISDSKIVNAAARSFYDELLQAGVEIFLYTKGFVHAKTMVVDRQMAIVGSANMDYRSFELNFEVNAIVYDTSIAQELADIFADDLRDANKIDLAAWNDRPWYRFMLEKTAKLMSPFL